jgi:3',5'-cyclic AMP phosphodiesterase CpdA
VRTLVHLSDLHFGRIDTSLLDPLVNVIETIAPDLVAVSGDLTQRARAGQFKAARAFLNRLPAPQIVVPGNHDIPLYDIGTRFTRPLAQYRRYITDDLEPWFIDDEMAVAGINTARSLTFKHGRINEVQIERVRQRLCHLPNRIFKIIVTHHPVDLPAGFGSHRLVGRAALARDMLSACACDLLLAGHLHRGGAAEGAARQVTSTRAPIVVQAGTAASTRGRGEANSFNVITIEPTHIEFKQYQWKGTARVFVPAATEHFAR